MDGMMIKVYSRSLEKLVQSSESDQRGTVSKSATVWGLKDADGWFGWVASGSLKGFGKVHTINSFKIHVYEKKNNDKAKNLHQ